MEKTLVDSLLFRLEAPHSELVREVIYSIPEKTILNPEAKFLDPAMGGGHFLKALLDRGISLGVSPEAMKKRLYGIERSVVYVNYARWKMGLEGVNFRTSNDYDLEVFDMQFDVIVGNPPYQRLREVRNIGAPLWPEFIEKGMSLLKSGGILDLLVPATWMNRKERGAWKFIAPHDLTYVDPDVKRFFPDVGGNGGTFSRLKLEKRPYGGITSIRNEFTVNFHTEDIPENNRLFNEDSLFFLREISSRVLDLDVKSGPTKPSINSSHWSAEKTDSHTYETYYSGDAKRRSLWCDEPVGDHGKLKLVVASSGKIYQTFEITTKGVGRQASYVLGTQEELELVRDKMLSEDSKRLCELKTAGNFTDPLRYVAG